MIDWLVFTDLDGTLLDRHTYDPHHSIQRVRQLAYHGIPLIFCSSKTMTEQRVIQSDLSVTDPFIVENGSAVMAINALTTSSQIVLGMPLKDIRVHLAGIAHTIPFHFRGFTMMSVAQVAALTGLDETAAARAQMREFSETIVLDDHAHHHQFQQLCHERGLQCVSGGKFLTVTGKNATKGRAIHALCQIYREQHTDIKTIGIGDSPNDRSMLEVVDHAFLVQRPDGMWCDMDLPHVERVSAIGPEGFSKVIDRLLRGDLAQSSITNR